MLSNEFSTQNETSMDGILNNKKLYILALT